jgi:predicted NACHT family NTPase
MLLRHSVLQWAAHPQRFGRVPVLVELARYNRGDRSIQQLLVETFAHRVEVGNPRQHHKRPRKRPLVDNAAQVVQTALDTGRLCVFLDGLDEVITERRSNLIEEIKEFAERNQTCQVVVTCRDAVYDDDLNPTFDRQIRVAGFDDAGIRHFLRLWFTRSRETAKEDE